MRLSLERFCLAIEAHHTLPPASTQEFSDASDSHEARPHERTGELSGLRQHGRFPTLILTDGLRSHLIVEVSAKARREYPAFFYATSA